MNPSAEALLKTVAGDTPTYRYRTPPRKIEGLFWAQWTPTQPHHTGGKLSGSAARGMTYQRKCTKEIRRISGGGSVLDPKWWIRFEDENGLGWAQPDIVLDYEDEGVLYILECKLTHHEFAHLQLESLYSPLLDYTHPGREHVLVEMFKNFGGAKMGTQISNLDDALNKAHEGILHWNWLP